LPGGRYPLPGPDFHRLERASFAWRTRVEIYRAKACRHRDDPAPVGACGPDSDSDHENGPGDGENPARHVRAAFSQAWRAVPEPILPTAQPSPGWSPHSEPTQSPKLTRTSDTRAATIPSAS